MKDVWGDSDGHLNFIILFPDYHDYVRPGQVQFFCSSSVSNKDRSSLWFRKAQTVIQTCGTPEGMAGYGWGTQPKVLNIYISAAISAGQFRVLLVLLVWPIANSRYLCQRLLFRLFSAGNLSDFWAYVLQTWGTDFVPCVFYAGRCSFVCPVRLGRCGCQCSRTSLVCWYVGIWMLAGLSLMDSIVDHLIQSCNRRQVSW